MAHCNPHAFGRLVHPKTNTRTEAQENPKTHRCSAIEISDNRQWTRKLRRQIETVAAENLLPVHASADAIMPQVLGLHVALS